MRASPLIILLLLLFGCTQQGGLFPQPEPEPPPPDYSYDLIIKDITTWPRTVYLGENYTVRVVVQRYGQYAPSGYRLNVLDGNITLYNEEIHDPGLIEWVEFNYSHATEDPRNMRAEVQSLDAAHPEPNSSLQNNVLRRTIRAQPLGYYGSCYSCMHLYYDAVNYVMRQAQAFNLTQEFTVHRIGLLLRAPINDSLNAPVIVEICRDDENNPGEPLASSSIQSSAVGPEPGWHYAQFQNLSLPAGRYWIVARVDMMGSQGVQWARSEANPYGEPYDTMVLDIVDWPEWDYKYFDFVFQIY